MMHPSRSACVREISHACAFAFLFCAFIFFLLASSNALASECPQIRGSVLVIGGQGATTSAMQGCYPDLLAISLEDAKKNLQCLADQIDGNKNGGKVSVVGHSSGAAPAELIAHLVRDKSKVRLILLEGFGNPAYHQGVETSCWFAESQTRSELRGFNAPSMLNPKVCPQPAHVSKSMSCLNSLCLHVSLVNQAVNPNLGKADIASALDSCKANRDWLN